MKSTRSFPVSQLMDTLMRSYSYHSLFSWSNLFKCSCGNVLLHNRKQTKRAGLRIECGQGSSSCHNSNTEACTFTFLFKQLSMSFLGPLQTTPEQFENGGFTLKTDKMFSVHTTPEKLKTQQSQAEETLECTREHAHSKVLVEPTWRNQHGNHHFGRHFGFLFNWGRLGQTNHLIIVTSSFEKHLFQNVFRPH